MTNLDELDLCLLATRLDATYIDGNDLYEQFLIYMRKLNKFTFNICTKAQNYLYLEFNFHRLKIFNLVLLEKDIQKLFQVFISV